MHVAKIHIGDSFLYMYMYSVCIIHMLMFTNTPVHCVSSQKSNDGGTSNLCAQYRIAVATQHSPSSWAVLCLRRMGVQQLAFQVHLG